MALKASNSKKPFVCPFCNTGFTKEKTLQSHMCEKKRRHQQKNEKRVRLGHLAFNQFYKIQMRAKKDKTYSEFCDSPQYNQFVKFGSYLANVEPLYPEKYIDHVINSGLKIEKWYQDETYEAYAIEVIRREGVETALERTINTMVEWAESTGNEWHDYFREVSSNRAVWHIRDGKVSPWLILNCRSGKAMMAGLNDEQLKMVYGILDPRHWSIRFNRSPADVRLVKDVAKRAGL